MYVEIKTDERALVEQLLAQSITEGARAEVTLERRGDTYHVVIVSGVTEPLPPT